MNIMVASSTQEPTSFADAVDGKSVAVRSWLVGPCQEDERAVVRRRRRPVVVHRKTAGREDVQGD